MLAFCKERQGLKLLASISPRCLLKGRSVSEVLLPPPQPRGKTDRHPPGPLLLKSCTLSYRFPSSLQGGQGDTRAFTHHVLQQPFQIPRVTLYSSSRHRLFSHYCLQLMVSVGLPAVNRPSHSCTACKQLRCPHVPSTGLGRLRRAVTSQESQGLQSQE